MRRALKWAVPSLLIAGIVAAGTIKVWSNGEALTASDLNGNFSHIHNLMVGGHGARLVNADVSASANISVSKIGGIIRGVVDEFDPCVAANGVCTLHGNGVSSITRIAPGVYDVALTVNPTDLFFPVLLGATTPGGGRACTVQTRNTASPHFRVVCWDLAVPTATAIGFSFVLFYN